MATLSRRLNTLVPALPPLNDRRGVAALEYALIAAAFVTVAISVYKAMFGNLSAFLGTIAFS